VAEDGAGRRAKNPRAPVGQVAAGGGQKVGKVGKTILNASEIALHLPFKPPKPSKPPTAWSKDDQMPKAAMAEAGGRVVHELSPHWLSEIRYAM
jgi:hypothetical protein